MTAGPQIAVRSAREGDLSSLACVWHDAWHASHAALDPAAAAHRDMAYFAARIGSILGRGLVAEREGEPIGFASWQGDGIAQCFVRPDCHRKGVGSALLTAAEQALAGAGHKTIWLHCREGNRSARAFYETHGWQVASTIDDEIGTHLGPMPSRSWHMEKHLEK